MNDTAFEDDWVKAIESNHEPPPCRGGDCPDQMHGRYLGPYSDGNEMGLTGWHAVAAKAGATRSELVVDLSHLNLAPGKSAISAVRYGAGSGGYNSTTGTLLVRELGSSRICCGPHLDPMLEPCGPARCPIMSSGSATSGGVRLPATPFFAQVTKAGKCRCFAPQVCDS